MKASPTEVATKIWAEGLYRNLYYCHVYNFGVLGFTMNPSGEILAELSWNRPQNSHSIEDTTTRSSDEDDITTITITMIPALIYLISHAVS